MFARTITVSCDALVPSIALASLAAPFTHDRLVFREAATADWSVIQRPDQREQAREAFQRQPLAPGRRSPVSPSHRQTHPAAGLALAHEHQRTAPPLDTQHGQQAAEQRVEGVRDRQHLAARQ
jgi:hypothetical protein